MSITDHPEVNTLIRELVQQVRNTLGSHLVGVYLFGSIATGDFDQDSDIDVLVVTEEALSGELFSALKALHAQIASGDSPWVIQLEVSYIPREALRRYDPDRAVHPHIDRGHHETLHWMHHDTSWIVQRHVLREQGITLNGPPLHTLIDPVSPDDLRQAMQDILQTWATPLLDDPEALQQRGGQSYTVLTLCRILYTLSYGTVASKREAARWAQAMLDPRWHPLIERTWEGRRHPGLDASPDDIRDTRAFIRYTLNRTFDVRSPWRTQAERQKEGTNDRQTFT